MEKVSLLDRFFSHKWLRPTMDKKLGGVFLGFFLLAFGNFLAVSYFWGDKTQLKLFLYAVLFLDFSLFIIAMIAVRRRFVVPLGKLSQAVVRLSAGERLLHLDFHSYDEIGELTTLFNQMVEAIRQFEGEKDDFIGIVSHELRTPLATIQLAIHNLAEGVRGPLNPEQKKVVERINKGLFRLNHIVFNLLKLCRFGSGRVVLNRKKLDLPFLIHEVIQHFKEQATSQNILLKEETSSDLPSIFADENYLWEVFSNLLANALRYAKSWITIKTIREKGQALEVSIINDGPEIDPQRIKTLFDTKIQMGESKQFINHGMGLGLKISKNIVELHGGRIWAESIVGKQTTFHFILPLSGGKQ